MSHFEWEVISDRPLFRMPRLGDSYCMLSLLGRGLVRFNLRLGIGSLSEVD